MTPIAYKEDAQKLKSGSLRAAIIGGVCVVIGLAFFANFSKLGYIEAGLGGGLLGGGVCGAFLGTKGLGRAGKNLLLTLVAADDEGITLSTGETTSSKIPWSNVQAIQPAQKGVNRGIAVTLKDQEAYLAGLSATEKKAAKQWSRLFGSPAAVNTANCLTGNGVIAQELSDRLQAVSNI